MLFSAAFVYIQQAQNDIDLGEVMMSNFSGALPLKARQR